MKEKKLVPLSVIRDGGYFRLPGKQRRFRKQDNLQTHLPDGMLEVNSKPGCMCVTSSGKTFLKGWWEWVEEAN